MQCAIYGTGSREKNGFYQKERCISTDFADVSKYGRQTENNKNLVVGREYKANAFSHNNYKTKFQTKGSLKDPNVTLETIRPMAGRT